MTSDRERNRPAAGAVAAARRMVNAGVSPPIRPEAGDHVSGQLGTFAGVFTPSILTILGLILFLRTGTVLGNVGIVKALLILAAATAVSVLTSMSLAAVATNLRVGGGGVYFLVSRTLGVEFGGAIGVVLFGAMAISGAFYVIGAAEVIGGILDLGDGGRQLVAAGLLLILAVFALAGADWATRLQYAVMAALIVALIAFFAGAATDFSLSTLRSSNTPVGPSDGFWVSFAIFFPAVTGFTQGVAMSGDLKNPSKSITTGTFAAVGLSTFVYLGVIIMLAGSASMRSLRDDPDIFAKLALQGWLVDIGIIAATVSSAMASMLGAPRVLQRLAGDHVFASLRAFAVGHGPSNNPRRAAILTAGIGLVAIALGDLDLIAPIISMFFLATYGLINYATYYEARAASPSFRPRFRFFDRRLSLAGAIGCALVVLAINPVAGAVAACILFALYSVVRRRQRHDRWSDSARAHHFSEARRHIAALGGEPAHRRDWRPCVLVFVPSDRERRRRLLTVADWLDGDVGLATAVRIIEGSGVLIRAQAEHIEAEMTREAVGHGLVGARVVVNTAIEAAVQSLVQAHGIGPIKSNTAMFNALDLQDPAGVDESRFGAMLQQCARHRNNVVVVESTDDDWEKLQSTRPANRRISIWWSDHTAGQLLTMFGWLTARSKDWSSATIDVHVPSGQSIAEVRALLDAARIEPRVMPVRDDAESFIAAMSRGHFALVPMRVRRGVPLAPNDLPIHEIFGPLPIVALVLANDAPDLVSEPDDQAMAAYALAVDRLGEIRARHVETARAVRLARAEAEDNSTPVATNDADAGENAQQRLARLERELAVIRFEERQRDEEVIALDPTSTRRFIDPALWEVEEPEGVAAGSADTAPGDVDPDRSTGDGSAG